MYNPGVDVGISDVFIDVNDEISVLSDINGNYALYPQGSELLDITCEAPQDFAFTDVLNYSLMFMGQDVFDLNFGLWKEIEPSELDLDITVSPFLCLSEVAAWITIENPGWLDASGDVTLTLPSDVTISSTYPETDQLLPNSVKWDFENLGYREQRSLFVRLQSPSVEQILNQFDSIQEAFIQFSAKLNYEGLTQEITQEYESNVSFLCAYDPNDKQSSSTGPSVDEYSLLEEDLLYTIRFQNEGNYKATDVILVDTIDSRLDIRTLNVISQSHEVQTEIVQPNIVKFRFIGIDLPPESEDEAGSQGFVKFKLSPIEELPDDSEILNTAYIYFDNNAPIVTNTVKNILVDELPIPISSVEESEVSHPEISVQPNPSTGDFTIETNSDAHYNYQVFDSQGRLILSKKNVNGPDTVTIEGKGLYFLVSDTNGVRSVEKLVIDY